MTTDPDRKAHEARPGTITEVREWLMRCALCDTGMRRPTYQEASIALTLHLELLHGDEYPERRRGAADSLVENEG